jgi:putative ABC transport system ATP-binding protein
MTAVTSADLKSGMKVVTGVKAAEPTQVPLEYLIELEGITKTFGTGLVAFQALKGVDLNGHARFLWKPSGAVRLATNRDNEHPRLFHVLTSESSGFAALKFRRLRGTSARRRAAAISDLCFRVHTCCRPPLENVELPLLYRGESKSARRKSALKALDLVGPVPWAGHTPAELSGGQQQRVVRPRIGDGTLTSCWRDELLPVISTPNARSRLAELLTELNKTGITILLVTHEQEMAHPPARRVFP